MSANILLYFYIARKLYEHSSQRNRSLLENTIHHKIRLDLKEVHSETWLQAVQCYIFLIHQIHHHRTAILLHLAFHHHHLEKFCSMQWTYEIL